MNRKFLIYFHIFSTDLVICFFDSTHHIPSRDKISHEQNCPGRAIMSNDSLEEMSYKPPPANSNHAVQ